MPASEAGLRLAIGKTHRHYARRVNFRKGWRGHLWQGRFASFPMDGAHLWQAACTVDRNPVQAGLAGAPEDWSWSSARPRILGGPDPLVALDCPLLLAREVRSWREFLAEGLAEAGREEFQRHERTGRPLGPEAFVAAVGQAVGRDLRPGKPGSQPKGS